MVRRSTCSTFLLLGFLSSAALADGRAPAPPPPVLPWYDAVDLDAFVDAYGSVDWGFPKPQTTDGAPTRYHHRSNGFALSWVGLNMSYAPEPVGGTVSLRFGPTAPLVAGPAEPDSLRYVKQAFASFRPGGPEGALTLDFGKFDTPFGAEAAESQENFNYTHGVLWAAQPLFHTGLRARYDLAAELSLVGLVANGINRSVDNNVGKTFGLKAELALLEWLDVGVGWLGGPEQDDFVRVACAEDTAYEPSAQGCAPSAGAPARSYTVDRGGANEFEAWTHLFDLVVTANLAPPFDLLLNASYGTTGARSQNAAFQTEVAQQRWYGAALAARYHLSEVWALAARGEYVVDESGNALGMVTPAGELVSDLSVATATLTLQARPTRNLILRLENRADFVLEGKPGTEVYTRGERESSDMLLTTTLGVVLTTD